MIHLFLAKVSIYIYIGNQASAFQGEYIESIYIRYGHAFFAYMGGGYLEHFLGFSNSCANFKPPQVKGQHDW